MKNCPKCGHDIFNTSKTVAMMGHITALGAERGFIQGGTWTEFDSDVSGFYDDLECDQCKAQWTWEELDDKNVYPSTGVKNDGK